MLGMAPGGKNAVESKLGSKPSHTGVTFPTWLSRLKALSASMSRSTCKPQLKRADTVRPCPAGWVRFSLSTRFGEFAGFQSEDWPAGPPYL